MNGGGLENSLGTSFPELFIDLHHETNGRVYDASLPEAFTPKMMFSAAGFTFNVPKVTVLGGEGSTDLRQTVTISNMRITKGELSKVESDEDGKRKVDVEVSMTMPAQHVSTSQAVAGNTDTVKTEFTVVVLPGSPAKIQCTNHPTFPISCKRGRPLEPMIFEVLDKFGNRIKAGLKV